MLPLDLIVGLEVIYFNIIRFIEADHEMLVADYETNQVLGCKV
jgi:hypothetical protein